MKWHFRFRRREEAESTLPVAIGSEAPAKR